MKHDTTSIPRGLLDRRQSARVLPLRQTPDARTAHYDLVEPVTQPDIHPAVAEGVIAALEAGETHYTARTGIEPLRAAIAGMVAEQGLPATADRTVVTNGGSEARFIVLQTLVSPGTRVRLVDPVDPDVVKLVEFMGGNCERVPGSDAGDLSGVEVLLLPVASGLDGMLFAEAQLVSILESAGRAGTRVLLDCSSLHDCYAAPPAFSRPDLLGQAITIGSFSGACGLSGWRAGYFTAPEDLMPRLAGLKESMSISTTTPTQFAMLAAIEHLDEILTSFRSHACARRDMVAGMLKAAAVPYQAPDVYPGLLVDVRASGLDDVEFVDRLMEDHSVRVEPASRYGRSLAGFVRIDMRAEDSALDAGIGAIAAMLKGESR